MVPHGVAYRLYILIRNDCLRSSLPPLSVPRFQQRAEGGHGPVLASCYLSSISLSGPDTLGSAMLGMLLRSSRQSHSSTCAFRLSMLRTCGVAWRRRIVHLYNCVSWTVYQRTDAIIAQELSAPHAMTKRDGQFKELPVKELVLGDVIQLKGGDIIPADCRVHCSFRLGCDEAVCISERMPTVQCWPLSYFSCLVGFIVVQFHLVALLHILGKACVLPRYDAIRIFLFAVARRS
jgi:hypothetical protein